MSGPNVLCYTLAVLLTLLIVSRCLEQVWAAIVEALYQCRRKVARAHEEGMRQGREAAWNKYYTDDNAFAVLQLQRRYRKERNRYRPGGFNPTDSEKSQ